MMDDSYIVPPADSTIPSAPIDVTPIEPSGPFHYDLIPSTPIATGISIGKHRLLLEYKALMKVIQYSDICSYSTYRSIQTNEHIIYICMRNGENILIRINADSFFNNKLCKDIIDISRIRNDIAPALLN